MRSIRLGITLEGESLESLLVLLEQTIERGMRRFRDSIPPEDRRPAPQPSPKPAAPQPQELPPAPAAITPSKDEALLLDSGSVVWEDLGVELLGLPWQP